MQDSALRDRVFQAGENGQGITIRQSSKRYRTRCGNQPYLPTNWLKGAGLSPADVICSPLSPSLDQLRARVLAQAKHYHDLAVWAIQYLPVVVQGSLCATVEGYMEIERFFTWFSAEES